MGGAVVAAILAEAGPLRLFSKHAIPWAGQALGHLQAPVQTPKWVLWTLPVVGGVFVLVCLWVKDLLQRKRTRVIFAELYWKRLQGEESLFWPICRQCGLTLQPRIEPEQRRDRNEVPFLFTPNYENALLCLRCNRSTPLHRPWSEVLREAHEFFSSAFFSRPLSLTRGKPRT